MSAEPPRTVTEPIDPELVSLRRRVAIGPILAASVLGFAALLMIRLRADLTFSRQGEKPADIGDIRGGTSPLEDDSFVSLVGDIDARAPARLRGIQDVGHRLAPLRGAGGHVWIYEDGEAGNVAPTYDGRFTGRLRRLRDLAFADDLHAYVDALPPQPRFVFPEALKDRLPDRDVEGEPLSVAPDTAVTVEEHLRDAAVVTLVKTDAVPDENAAREALQRAGLAATLTDRTAASWTFDVRGADSQAARDKLRAARLFGASADPKVAAHTGRLADLRVAGDNLVLGAQSIPRAAIGRVILLTPPRLPADAWVLLTGDTPGRLWYMPPLYGLLAVIALLMVWALAVAIRQLRKSRADSPA